MHLQTLEIGCLYSITSISIIQELNKKKKYSTGEAPNMKSIEELTRKQRKKRNVFVLFCFVLFCFVSFCFVF